MAKDESPITPSLARMIKDAIESRVTEIHTGMPAIIETFDPSTCMASVVPQLQRKYSNGEIVDLPIIQNVPVQFPRGGGAVIEFDLQKGDPVWLLFSERSLDIWLSKGGKVDPKDPRKHALSDAVALPGVYPKNMPVDDALIRMAFKKDGSLKVSNGGGFFTLDKDANFQIENSGLRVSYSKSGKIKILGIDSSTDFIAQLLLTIDKLVETTKVMTLMGPQPFVPDPGYITERAKLDPFKE